VPNIYYKLGIGWPKSIVLLTGVISIIFLFASTAFAGSTASYKSHDLSQRHWKNGYHYSAKQYYQNHKYRHFYRHRHLRYKNHKFYRYPYPSFGVWGGYYDRDAGKNIQINLVLPPDKQTENSETTKEVKEPLPPHLETLTEEKDTSVSSYQVVHSGNTAAHIVEYRADRQ
jgi:hypothetical protein